MARYELSGEFFFTIELSGSNVTTCVGKIGNNGHTRMKMCNSAAEAEAKYDELVAEKLEQGYELVADAPKPKKPAAKAAPAAPAPKAKPPTARAAPAGTVKAVQLFYQEGSSDKVYHAEIVADGDLYTVKCAWGRRGSTLNQGSKAVKVTLDVATRKFESLVREKTNKGYEPITDTKQPAAVAPPEGEGSGSKVGGKRAKVGLPAQLLNPIEDDELDAYLANDDMVAQQKLDGQRVLVTIGEQLVITNRDGQITNVDPRAFSGLSYLPHGTTVDGELLDGTYWLFDVLGFGGDDVRRRGYLERFEILDGEIEPALSDNVKILPVASTKAAKRKLHDKLRAAGAEGIVFKDREAPYTAGRPASGGAQRKLKFLKSADVVILENAGNAYRMAVYDGRQLFDIGKVFAGTTNASRKLLDAALGRGERPVCEVRYLYATDDHQLFQPVFVRSREDKAAKTCVRDQLVTTNRKVVVVV
jgi:bifunctional non-homologous end joining protein LigD